MEASAGDYVAHVTLLLALVLVAAKVGGELAVRLGQAAVLGELLAGMLLGNLPWAGMREVHANPSLDLLSRLGVLVLLFEVGLESTVRGVIGVGRAAVQVALLGTLGTFAVGFVAALSFFHGEGLGTPAFVGAAITATSVGISARVCKDLGKTRTREARTILGAAVLDDVLGLVVLALANALLAHRTSSASPLPLLLVLTVVKTLGFLAGAIFVSMRLTPRLFGLAARLRTGGTLLAFGLSFCFLLAWAADAVGLAPLVGAFAAGLVLEDAHSADFVARGERSLSQLIEPISGFLVPIFFVVMGSRADVGTLTQPRTLALASVLVVAAIVGKLACGLGVEPGVGRAAVAFGMMPRGEVTLIFASMTTTLSLTGSGPRDQTIYSALVAVVIVTTLLTPAALKWAFRRPIRALG